MPQKLFPNLLFSNRQSGFTLIELLIVVAIIGTLVTIAFPRLGGVREAARETAAVANMRSLMTELETYRIQHRGFHHWSDPTPGEIDSFDDLTSVENENGEEVFSSSGAASLYDDFSDLEEDDWFNIEEDGQYEIKISAQEGWTDGDIIIENGRMRREN